MGGGWPRCQGGRGGRGPRRTFDPVQVDLSDTVEVDPPKRLRWVKDAGTSDRRRLWWGGSRAEREGGSGVTVG